MQSRGERWRALECHENRGVPVTQRPRWRNLAGRPNGFHTGLTSKPLRKTWVCDGASSRRRMILARLRLSRAAGPGSSIGQGLLALISKVLTWPARSPLLKSPWSQTFLRSNDWPNVYEFESSHPSQAAGSPRAEIRASFAPNNFGAHRLDEKFDLYHLPDRQLGRLEPRQFKTKISFSGLWMVQCLRPASPTRRMPCSICSQAIAAIY